MFFGCCQIALELSAEMLAEKGDRAFPRQGRCGLVIAGRAVVVEAVIGILVEVDR